MLYYRLLSVFHFFTRTRLLLDGRRREKKSLYSTCFDLIPMLDVNDTTIENERRVPTNIITIVCGLLNRNEKQKRENGRFFFPAFFLY
jgi:hypothetical protein